MGRNDVPLTAAQIVQQACQNAQAPGWTTQASNFLNLILQDLYQNYDTTASQKDFYFTLPTTVDSRGRCIMSFPADYLRAKPMDCFYWIQGVPYQLIPQDLAEMDMMVVTAGLSNFPVTFAVDTSKSPPQAYFWMPSSGAYQALVRYQGTMPDIPVPADATVPWFPNQMYLLTRLTGELCKIADDERHELLLSDDPERAPGGAGTILRRYMQMTGDRENRAQTVKLDRRRFGSSFDRLRNTKQVGW
jgi:hypothetical protein